MIQFSAAHRREASACIGDNNALKCMLYNSERETKLKVFHAYKSMSRNSIIFAIFATAALYTFADFRKGNYGAFISMVSLSLFFLKRIYSAYQKVCSLDQRTVM